MARHAEAEGAGQHHLDVPAAAVAGIEPGQEPLADRMFIAPIDARVKA